MKAARLVEQESLGALEEHGRRVAQPAGQQIVRRDQPGKRRHLFDPAIDDAGMLEGGPLAHGGRHVAGQGGKLGVQPIADAAERADQARRVAPVGRPHRLVWMCRRVGHGLAQADAAASVARGPARQLAQAVGSLVKGRDDPRRLADAHARQRIGDSLARQRARLEGQGSRMHQHLAGQERAHSGHEAGRADLREGVVPTVGRDDIVAGLAAAVEAHDDAGAGVAGQEVGDQALPAVAEAEVDDGQGDKAAHRDSGRAMAPRVVQAANRARQLAETSAHE
jgi:hypothetical protein